MTAPTTKSKSKKTEHAAFGNARIEKYYTKIVTGFIILTILLVLLIVYFSFSKTTIVIHPTPTERDISLETSVEDLDGTILLTDTEASKTVSDLEGSETKTGKATGKVTIVNNYSSGQPLVATTRLLSKEGVLFRTQESVTVPAGGSVEVGVIADEEGEKGDIGPSEFEIVALWDGLKDDIKATSSEPMSGGKTEIAIVSQTDVANAKNKLEQELIQKAEDTFADEIQKREELSDDSFFVQPATIIEHTQDSSSAQAGDAVEEFTVTEKATVAGIVINTKRLEEAIKEQLGQATLVDIPLEDAKITIEELNADHTNADLTVKIPVNVTIDEQSDLLQSDQLTNKTEQEIKDYFDSFEEVDSVDLKFSPFWLRKTPSLADHISIIVE